MKSLIIKDLVLKLLEFHLSKSDTDSEEIEEIIILIYEFLRKFILI